MDTRAPALAIHFSNTKTVLFLYVLSLYVLFLYVLFLYVLSFYNTGKWNVPSYRSDTCNPGLLWPTWVCLRDC